MRRILLAVFLLSLPSIGFAVVPSNEVFLASVGKGPGSCVNGVCAFFDTTAWLFNPNNTPASVTLYFLARDQANPSPVSKTTTIPAGATYEIQGLVAYLTGSTKGFGAVRVVSSVPLVVTSRIFDSNVVTNKGTGSAGQFFAGLPAAAAIRAGEFADLIGLSQDADGSTGVERTNFGAVETTGQSVTIEAQRLDSTGAVLATKSYNLGAYQPMQLSITDIGGANGTSQRVRIKVTSGAGRVIPFASLLQNATGDPSTIEMANYTPGFPLASLLSGTWSGDWVNQTFGSTGTVTMNLNVNTAAQTYSLTLDLNGNVFGGNNPGPVTFTGPYGPAGGSISGTNAIGKFTATFDVTGHIQGTITNVSNPSISRVDFVGSLLTRSAAIEYTVYFTNASTAVGVMYMTKN